MTVPAATVSNVEAWGVDGSSDDLDVPLAKLFQDAAFREKYNLGTLNSINFGRVLVQVAHYFYAWFRVRGHQPDASVSFAVPTGAAGHIVAGLIAKRMGLPATALCAATNENKVFATFANEGVLQKLDSVLVTNSPSMDIQIPYNVERILWLLEPDRLVVADTMRSFQLTGRIVLTPAQHRALTKDLGLCASHTDSAKVSATIDAAWHGAHYLLDPHSVIKARTGFWGWM